MRKFSDYATMGIPEIWIIDPEARTFSRYEAGQLVLRDHFSLKGMDFDTAEITKLVR
jgi:Uma2 family endonuclease